MRSAIRLGMICLLLVAGCSSPMVDLNQVVDIDKIMLAPDTQLTITPSDLGYDYQEISVPVAEGRSVAIWYIPAPQPKGLIVVIPGAADNRSLYARLALPLIGSKGYDIVLMDYEGFGNSPGEATLKHAVDDALAVTAFAMTRHETVIVYGISLGTPLAARVAAVYDVAAVVMDGNLVVDDAMELYASHLPFLQAEGLRAIGPRILHDQLPKDYDILKYVAVAHGAKLIIHSPQDTLTPFASGLSVYQAASPPKTFWQEYDDHGRMIRVEPDVYADTLLTWVDAVLSAQ